MGDPLAVFTTENSGKSRSYAMLPTLEGFSLTLSSMFYRNKKDSHRGVFFISVEPIILQS
jgi:hypothetical protein